MTSETREGKTPNGGVKSTAFYRDDQGQPAKKDVATRVEIVEYDKNNKQINRTYGRCNREVQEQDLREAGFTGIVTDKLGRKIHFVNGERVKGEQKPEDLDSMRQELKGMAVKTPAQLRRWKELDAKIKQAEAKPKEPEKKPQGKTPDEIRQELSKTTGQPPDKIIPDPWHLRGEGFPEGVDGKAFAASVGNAIDKAKAASGLAMPPIHDVYESVKKEHPNLSRVDFQKSLIQLQKAGQVSFAGWTLSPMKIPHPEDAFPQDNEAIYFVGRKSSENPSAAVDKPGEGDHNAPVEKNKQEKEMDKKHVRA